MARSKSSSIDKARQAALRNAKSLFREFSRTRTKAKQLAAKQQDKELVAQWRTLRKLGFVNTRVNPAQKNLTPFRKREIKKAFFNAQNQGAFKGGKVVRPLKRQVISTERIITNKAGKRKRIKGQRIKYVLDNNFQLVKSKHKPTQESGYVKTRKGFLFEKTTPTETIRITSKGKIKRNNKNAGGFIIESEGITGEDIFKLIIAIKNGSFKLHKNQAMQVHNFGEGDQRYYGNDSLDQFVQKFERYEQIMHLKTFQHWIDSTEIRVVTL